MTSGRRALIAAWGQERTGLPTLYVIAWADACATLVEGGWPTAARTVLAQLLTPADLDGAGRVLLGGMPPEPNELERRQLAHALADLLGPADDLPPWASVGVQFEDEVIFARPTLDLDEAEAADVRQWPPVTVAAYQTVGADATVLLEVGASAPPVQLEPGQARRVSTALLDAAIIVDDAREATR